MLAWHNCLVGHHCFFASQLSTPKLNSRAGHSMLLGQDVNPPRAKECRSKSRKKEAERGREKTKRQERQKELHKERKKESEREDWERGEG